MERGDEGSAVFIRDRLRSVDLGGEKEPEFQYAY